jgi:hypothetical protein
MRIQSLSIDIPAVCINDCYFCVAKMHANNYPNMFKNKRFYNLYQDDWMKRLLFARDNGCNTVMLTGNGEPILNQSMLEMFGTINKNLESPFRWIELQTSGTTLNDEKLRFLRNHVGVNTISLSLSSIFSSEKNAEYNRTKFGFEVDIDHLCSEIKRYDFNLRLSLNMTDIYRDKSPEETLLKATKLGADQVTFRVLYSSPEFKDSVQNTWIKVHGLEVEHVKRYTAYVIENGRPLERLPHGAVKYSIHGLGVVIDNDCMSTEIKESFKYLILRPNCKLYSKWDDPASLVF